MDKTLFYELSDKILHEQDELNRIRKEQEETRIRILKERDVKQFRNSDYWNPKLGLLLGIGCKALFVEPGEHSLFFECSGYEGYLIETEADCCSETWFADILGVDNLLNQQITKVELLTFPENSPQDNRCRQEYDLYYGFRLGTNEGICDVIYRNSSNGYYGGSAFLTQLPCLPKGLHTWKQITEDWSA